MKTKLLILALLFTALSTACAENLSGSSSSQPPQGGEKQAPRYIRTKSGGILDVNSAAKAQAERKAELEAHGYKYLPPEEGIPGYVEEYFTIPKAEELDDCMYVIGHSFPARCFDTKGSVIFDAAKDDQTVLDKIIKKQGKKGKYNKMPNGGPMKYEGVEMK